MLSNLYDSHVLQSIDIKNYVKHMVEFIVTNRGTLNISEKIKENLSSDSMIKTVISEIFKIANNEKKLNLISFLDFSKKTNIPEGFVFSYWNLDILQIKNIYPDEYRILTSFPEVTDKILYNITSIINSKQERISDINKLQQTVIRDFLCRSYYNCNDNWLTPSILYFITKVYSLVISSNIARSYNLPYDTQMFIATILSIYFTQKCHNKSAFHPILNRLDYLNKMINIRNVVDIVTKDYGEKELTLSNVCEIIKNHSQSSRLVGFNEKALYLLTRSTNPNQIVSTLSLEYPPYWLFNILLSLSGMKTNLYHSIKNLNLNKEAMLFTKEIIESKQLIYNVY